MPVIHHAIDVAAPAEACWRCFADLSRWPEWFPFLIAARFVDSADDGALRIGAQMELTFEVGSVRVTVPTTIEEIELGPRFAIRWVGARLGVRGEHSYRFEETRAEPVRTRVTCHEEWTGLAARLMPQKLVERLDDETHASLDKLKALIES